MVNVDPNKIMKCRCCMAVFREGRSILESAGRADGKEYYNTRCPSCGTVDRMNEDYVGIPDEVLEKLDKGDIHPNKAMSQRDEELKEKEMENAKHPSDF